MSSLQNIIAGLQIFDKYNGDVSAEHDVIYAGCMTNNEISQEDQDKLSELGWKFNDGLESWYHFV